MKITKIKLLSLAALSAAVLAGLSTDASALPAFARKYGLSCDVCHTSVPHLTRAGFEFRRQGFRMPGELGQEPKFDGLKDMYTLRMEQNFQADTHNKGQHKAATNQFITNEVGLHFLVGPINKYWSTNTELAYSPASGMDAGVIYVKGAYQLDDGVMVSGRFGLMPSFEGYGGSDRPISSMGVMFRENSAVSNSGFDTLAAAWEQSRTGVDMDLNYKDTTLSFAAFNSRKENLTEDGLVDVPNKKDFRLFVNQMLGDKAAVSAEYTAGRTGFDFGGGAGGATDWTDNYIKTALYANYAIAPKLELLGGLGYGQDYRAKAGANDHPGIFHHSGWYAEAQSKLCPDFTGAFRYEEFRPTTEITGSAITAMTFTGVVMPTSIVSTRFDYQLKKSPGGTYDNTFLVNMMVLF